ncbi:MULTISPECIES: ribonucleoside triphosphate reductase [Mesotoga]|jgi:ribonucleoside-triphosphate reductase|uniref:ribonucleoside triphosphate reductase n=1 Tax=Mesotoga TaxID=1184396 RepID=UPI0002C8BA10|nr:MULTISPECIES: ribonucleoside triphosphate reductase [Mesotoga]MCP5456889.1 ribonucleoside triphosphate reductase [Thermotogota bacterium]CCU86013.1 Anaerobic ribonucleoside-triphosphate reductase [Mesotoga infera]MCB1222384.1 ribonucleoside triphosphate reductase [Mesotoga sp.]MCP5461066.1 ribonucleoside triphosphate reductase [Thermotogota bacterium]HNQ70019.1 ribonucleoside triphosphate reductase [Mesotoga prima]
MLNVRKRNGAIVGFDLDKIINAMKKAFDATETHYNEDILERVALRVVADFQPKATDNLIDIEDIQDSVERTLESLGFTDVAKSYILYRRHREKLRELDSSMLDFSKTVNSYLDMLDWRVHENSTVTYSIGGLILHNSGTVTANYWLREIYDPQIGNAHREGDIHIHDLSMLSGYCAGWSLKQLIEEGLGGVTGKVSSSPAKHLSTLVNQMVNFLGILQNEWAGAQAFSSFDTYLAPFVKIDNLSLKEVKQNIQSFVFGVNTPSRWGTQAPFTNITLDWVVPTKLRTQPAIVGGKALDFTYGDCQEEMRMINRAFLEVLDEGDANGRGFQYPIPTYNITKDFDWEDEDAKLLFEITSKYGTPYFQNFINSDLDPDDVRSMCCRLQLDKRELKRRGGGLFGSDEFTGSIGVVTINLPRIAYLSKNEEEFFARLSKMMDLSSRSLEIKRAVVEKLNNEGLYPYTKRYLKNFDNHFSTIGLVGMNEASLNARWIKKAISEEEGYQFALRVLDFMRSKMMDYQEATGHLYNLEATPAESTAYRLAKTDKEKFPQIITAGKENPYYTNSSHLPVDYTRDIFSALDLQEELQQKYTGGTVFHSFLGERISDWETTKQLVRKIAENYKIPYFTISPTYSICPDHGYIRGEHFTCPECGKPTEVYSRITGYYRPVQNWNTGKQEEFKTRETYRVGRERVDEFRRNRERKPSGLSGESSPDTVYLKL